MTLPRLSRRLLLQLAASLPFGIASARAGGPLPAPADQGIGGTGLSVKGGEGDHGIGGTGVYGRIQRFGSIYVNEMRIRYGDDAAVFIDGRRVKPDTMRVGHVVRTVIAGPPDHPWTRRIDITSEVVGPVERVDGGRAVVLSQTVDLSEIGRDAKLRKGAVVAVFGIRAPDGRIVASRIEPRGQTQTYRLRGVAEAVAGGLRIGGLIVARPAGALAGRRVVAVIGRVAKGLKLVRIEAEVMVPGLASGRVIAEIVRAGGRDHVGQFHASRPARGASRFERTYVDLSVGPAGRGGPDGGFGSFRAPPGSGFGPPPDGPRGQGRGDHRPPGGGFPGRQPPGGPRRDR